MFREKTGRRLRSEAKNPEAPTRPLDQDVTKEEKEDMIDQAEELEGPDRREIRDRRPIDPEDPGVASS
jgi:hypothetical protein